MDEKTPTPQIVYIKKESAVVAGFTGCCLSFWLSPIILLTGLCCFKTSRARSSLFYAAAVGAILLAAGLFVYYSLSNTALDQYRNSDLYKFAQEESGFYYQKADGELGKCVEINESSNNSNDPRTPIESGAKGICKYHESKAAVGRTLNNCGILRIAFVVSASVYLALTLVYVGVGFRYMNRAADEESHTSKY